MEWFLGKDACMTCQTEWISVTVWLHVAQWDYVPHSGICYRFIIGACPTNKGGGVIAAGINLRCVQKQATPGFHLQNFPWGGELIG